MNTTVDQTPDTRLIRILVCGGRDYRDRAHVNMVLNGYYRLYPKLCIVHGDAPGADTLAREWASMRGLPMVAVPAQWAYHSKHAGHLRNQWMLDYVQPHIVIAFPGAHGTGDMKTRARRAGVTVYEA